MSETQVVEQPQNGEPVSIEDLQRMLGEATAGRDAAARERETERSARLRAEQERDTERNARLLTETERDTNAGRIVNEAEQRYNAQKDAVKSGIEAQEGIAASAEDAFARHLEIGDHKAAAATQRQLASAEAKLTQLRAQQEYLEGNKEKLVPPAVKPETRQTQPLTRPSGDALSQIVPDVMPSERTFLEGRPQFLTDPNYQQSVFDASRIAARKHPRGSEGYIQEIARVLGEESTQEPVRQPSPRQPSADLTPQRRAAPGQQPQGARQSFELSRDEAEAANDLFGHPNQDNYIENEAARFKYYYDMKQRRIAAGRG